MELITWEKEREIHMRKGLSRVSNSKGFVANWMENCVISNKEASGKAKSNIFTTNYYNL